MFSAIQVWHTIFNFWHSGTLALTAKHQSAQMWKIKTGFKRLSYEDRLRCLNLCVGWVKGEIDETSYRCLRCQKVWIQELFIMDNNNSLFCLVRVGGVNTIGDKTKQFCLVSTLFPICNCSVSNISRITENLKIGNKTTKLIETGSRQDKTLLSYLQLCSHRRREQDKTGYYCYP